MRRRWIPFVVLVACLVGVAAVYRLHGLFGANTAALIGGTRSEEIIECHRPTGLGLLLDTFVIRSLVTPSIATLLGRWFWWPKTLPKRPVRNPLMADDALAAPEPVAVTVAADHEATIRIPTGDARLDPSADSHR